MNHSDKLTVVTAVNESYRSGMFVMLGSLASSLAPGYSVSVKIICTFLEQGFRQEIQRFMEHLGFEWEEVLILPDELPPFKVTGHITIESYFRLLLPDLFPCLDRVIYLDADLLVLDSIHHLADLEISESLVLASPHAHPDSGYVSGPRGLPSYVYLNLYPMTRTFNAGVMVMNLAGWRAERISERICDYLQTYRDQVLWWDQDGLNAVLHARWKPLSARWNVMTSHFREFASHSDSLLDMEEYATCIQNPAIIHFSGPEKPWQPFYSGPYGEWWAEAASAIGVRAGIDIISTG